MSLVHSPSAHTQPATDGPVVSGHTPGGKWTLREAGHYNGGKEWFGYLMRCVQEPRLSRFDRYTRKDRSVTSTWRVDGDDVKSLPDAMEELKNPPRLTMLEAATLAQIGTEPTDLRKVHDYAVMSALRNKGAVAYGPPGRARRVMSDADVLAQLSRLESNASGNPEWESVAAKVNAARADIAKATTPAADTQVGIGAADEPKNIPANGDSQ